MTKAETNDVAVRAPWPLELCHVAERVFLYDGKAERGFDPYRRKPKLVGVLQAHVGQGIESIRRWKVIDGHIYVAFQTASGRNVDFERCTRLFSVAELKAETPPDEYVQLWDACYREACELTHCELYAQETERR